MKKETEVKKKTVKKVAKPKTDAKIEKNSKPIIDKEKVFYVAAVSCTFFGALIGLLLSNIGNILNRKVDNKETVANNVVSNTEPHSFKPQENRVPEKYSDLLVQIDYSSSKDYNKDGKTAVLVDGDEVEYIGFVSNKHVYISVPNLNGDRSVFFRIKDIDNASKIRIFNQMGYTGFAPAFYVICEDGKVFEVPAYHVSKDLVISQVFNDYKIADIIELDASGYAELLLLDGKTQKIN